ncbi:MAG: insulinase family protein [Spirochaetales bacterium]|nr:insulinase family protein [Spirochaetales bacterium]
MNIPKKGELISRFEVLSIDKLDEYRSVAIHLEHIKTGCKVYKIINEDEENLFSFTFRTPPSDNSGVAHILEHTVLCGSEKFPVKDPFLSMAKGSMNTFLNAMTFPDKTMYPAGSAVEQDYFNLMHVYGDAVFFPLLKEHMFRQEGHRLEIDEEGRLYRTGIVFNEMKGSYSSVESIAAEWSGRSLFPDNTYGYDSGGDPDEIPELTYQQFVSFHNTYYHPSNCLISLYGNSDLKKNLDFIDENFLSRFDGHRLIDSEVRPQKMWSEPVYMEKFWPSAPEDENLSGKTTHTLNWRLFPVTEPEKVIETQIVAEVLMGNAGSPLLKALQQSEVGEDVSPVSGLEMELQDLIFTAAVRGSDPEKRDDFVRLVFETLNEVVDKGIDDDLIEGAIHAVEFRVREIRGGGPFGLRLIRKQLRGWLHGAGPSRTLRFNRYIEQVRKNCRTKGYLENLIKELFLENRHYSVVTVRPDPSMQQEADARHAEAMDRLKESMSKADLEDLERKNRELKEYQETPDPEEARDSIPSLSRKDVPHDILTIPTVKGLSRGIHWYRHELFTNGIIYCDMGFTMDSLAPELIIWMPLFCKALSSMGMKGIPYDETARLLSLHTGGFGCSLEASSTLVDDRMLKVIYVRFKMLSEQRDAGLELVSRLIREIDFTDLDRLKDLILEIRNDYKSSIIPSGHSYAMMRSGCRFSEASALEESWYGITQLEHLASVSDDLSAEALGEIAGILNKVRSSLFNREAIKINVTAPIGEGDAVVSTLIEDLNSLEAGEFRESPLPRLFRHDDEAEGLSVPSTVSYVSLSIPGSRLGTKEHASSLLLSHLLKTGYLWEQIRMRGGAYGAFASISGLEGVFSFGSYRDPNIVKTLEAYKKSLEFMTENVSDDDLEKALIGMVGKELRPLSPAESGIVSFKRDLLGITDEIRQKKRDYLLETSVSDIKKAASDLLERWDEAVITVISGSDALTGAAADIPALEGRIRDLPQ